MEHPYAERLKQRLKLPEDLVLSLSEDVGKHGARLAVDGKPQPALAIFRRLTLLVVFSVFSKCR